MSSPLEPSKSSDVIVAKTAVGMPIVAVVFIAFLVIDLALPVLPLHVHQDLGLGTFVVGLVAGAQFAASLFSRFWAGNYADSRGAKRALVTGLLVAAAAGLLYFLSLLFVDEPKTSVTILLLGRAVLGAAESFIVTGAFAWGLALVGPQNTGQIMAWVGTAMYAAFAVGAPAGTSLYAAHGFAAIALATTLIPLFTLMECPSLWNVDATEATPEADLGPRTSSIITPWVATRSSRVER